MRGDVLTAVPPSAHKTHGSSLKLSLHDVKETEDEDEGNDSHKGSTAANHNNNNNNNNGNNNGNVSLTWADNKHAHSFDSSTDGAPKSPETTHSKKRSQSAKRPGQNGQSHSSDSPLSNRSPPSSKKLEPPKSAPSQKWRVSSSKGRTLRSRERGDSAGESAEHRAASPSHQQRPANRTSETPAGGGGGGGGVRSSSRQSKRRPPSRSEDFSSSSSGDLPFPRSTSDRQRPSLTGTSSSDSSDDPRQERPSLTSSGSLAGGGGGGVKRGSLVGGGGGGGGYPASPTPSTGSRAWDFFEEHVRTIQGAGGDMFSSYQGPSFQASPTFQEAMVDMFGYPDYSHPPPTPVVNRGFAVAGAASRFLRLRKRSSAVGPLAGGGRERVVDQRTVDNAKRGWRILKQYVQENYTSKRTSQAALSWSMLRHTLKGMSDMQKARLDLYRRYGVIPTLNDDGSVMMVNTMLSERAQKAIANGSRHPLLVHSTKPHPHPLSASLPAALSSPLTSPRSSAGVGQRRASSSVVRGARVDVRPLSTMSGAGGSGVGLLSLRLGAPRHRSELSSRSSSRSHTP